MKRILVGVVLFLVFMGSSQPIQTSEPEVPIWEKVAPKDPVEIQTPRIIEKPAPKYETREFTYDEAQMLMRIAQAEAGNQGIEGMKLIMEVVLNRKNKDGYPGSIEGVIFQPHQFQPVSDGRYYSVELSPEVHLALSEIEQGLPIDENIVAFEITSSNSLERYFKYAYTVGDHNFYVEKGEKK